MEVERVYTCVICGRSFSSRSALIGHKRVHRDVEFARLSVRLPRPLVESFKRVCDKHKTTTCSLIHAFVSSIVRSDELGLSIANIASNNPLIIQVNQIFASRPRGHGKYDPELIIDRLDTPKCVLCNRDAIYEGIGEGERRILLCERHSHFLTLFCNMWRRIK